MNNQLTSITVRAGSIANCHLPAALGAALAIGLAACSNGDEVDPAAHAAPASTPVPAAASASAATANAGTPSAPGSDSSMPVDVTPEGQDVGGLAPPDVAMQPGGVSSITPSEAGPVDAGSLPPGAGAAVPSAGCGRTRTLQDGPQAIASGGLIRSYYLKAPATYDSTRPHRVIFMFHWNYGSIDAIVNPPDADQNTDRPFYGLADLADDGTIFVVPQGLVNPGGGAGWANPDNRDVNFTDDVLAAISADLCLDTSRVFTTGFSYGAGMSVALACVRPDTFRAAVVYAPAFISGVAPEQCTTPVPFFQSHGVDDPVINYQTGLSVLDTFTTTNGCTPLTPPEPPADGHGCVSLEGCAVPTRFCNFGAAEGNPFNTSLRGHYPSSKDPGQGTSWVPAEAWSFISQF